MKNKNRVTSTEYINIDNTTYICNYNYQYIIDNNLSNIKLEISHPKDIEYEISKDYFELDNNKYIQYHISMKDIDLIKIYKIIIKDLEKHIIRNYNGENLLKVKIYLSEENYKIITNNYNKINND